MTISMVIIMGLITQAFIEWYDYKVGQDMKKEKKSFISL